MMIGETIADPDDPQPLPLIVVDEPSLAVTIAINTSPLAGRSGSRLTARMIKDRLDRELLGNVGLRVLDTDRPDTWEVQGRGEMQFAVLAEMMRREGFEITIGKPRVVTRTSTASSTSRWSGCRSTCPRSTRASSSRRSPLRKGRMESMTNHGTGWVRLEYLVPARGLLGFRSEFQTETRGTGQLHSRLRGATSRGRATSRAGRTARWSPTAPARRPGTRSRTSRPAACCSSAPARTSTRG